MKPRLPAYPFSIFLAAAFPLHAHDAPPLKAGDSVLVEIRQTANRAEKPLIGSVKLDESGHLAVPGLHTPVDAEGLTPSHLTKAIAAAFRAEKQSAPFSIVAVTLPPKTVERIKPGAFLCIEAAEAGLEISSSYIISKSGHVSMPSLKQPVAAAGLTEEKLAEAITKAYTREKIKVTLKVRIRSNGDNSCPVPTFIAAGKVSQIPPQSPGLNSGEPLKAADGAWSRPSRLRLFMLITAQGPPRQIMRPNHRPTIAPPQCSGLSRLRHPVAPIDAPFIRSKASSTLHNAPDPYERFNLASKYHGLLPELSNPGSLPSRAGVYLF